MICRLFYASEYPGCSKYKVGSETKPSPNPVTPPGDIFTNMGFGNPLTPDFWLQLQKSQLIKLTTSSLVNNTSDHTNDLVRFRQ